MTKRRAVAVHCDESSYMILRAPPKLNTMVNGITTYLRIICLSRSAELLARPLRPMAFHRPSPQEHYIISPTMNDAKERRVSSDLMPRRYLQARAAYQRMLVLVNNTCIAFYFTIYRQFDYRAYRYHRCRCHDKQYSAARMPPAHYFLFISTRPHY